MRQPMCVVVSSMELNKSDGPLSGRHRMDAGHFTGNSNELREKLRSKRVALRRAICAYRNAKQAVYDEDERLKLLLASGKIRVLQWRD